MGIMPKVNWELNLGHILTIAAFGLSAWAFVNQTANKAENALAVSAETRAAVRELAGSTATRDALAAVEARMDRGFRDVGARLDTVAASVQPLATIASRLTEAERRLTEQDTRDNRQDERVGRVEQDVAGIRAQLEVEARPGRRVVPR